MGDLKTLRVGANYTEMIKTLRVCVDIKADEVLGSQRGCSFQFTKRFGSEIEVVSPAWSRTCYAKMCRAVSDKWTASICFCFNFSGDYIKDTEARQKNVQRSDNLRGNFGDGVALRVLSCTCGGLFS